MTSNYTEEQVAVLLREAMHERASTASVGPQPSSRDRRGTHRLATAALAAVAVVAITVGAASLIGGSRADRSVLPAAPGQSDDGTTAPDQAAPAGHPAPGGNIVTPLATPVTVTGSGTQTVHLGVPPAGTTAIDIQFTCLSAGYFEFSDGAAIDCADRSIGTPTAHSTYQIPAGPQTRDTTITASAGGSWALTATYSKITTSPWGVNERGQTYGVQNDSGTPDLVAAVASNGKEGYVLRTDLDGGIHPKNPSQAATMQPPAPRTIPVFESDGSTQIGEFTIN